jgi:hypothetical protein
LSEVPTLRHANEPLPFGNRPRLLTIVSFAAFDGAEGASEPDRSHPGRSGLN